MVVLRRAARFALSTHVVISSASILYGSGLNPRKTQQQQQVPCPASGWASSKSSSGSGHVPASVAAIYAGTGTRALLSDGAKFSPRAVFDDPAARCEGMEELVELAEALEWMGAEHREPPVVRGVHRRVGPSSSGSSRWVFDLKQNYAGGWIKIDSTLLVDVDGAGRIERMEEQWNGMPVLGGTMAPAPATEKEQLLSTIFFTSRRINGVASYYAFLLINNARYGAKHRE